jgi:hypothetical protein
MLQALADAEIDPATVAALADQRWRASPAQLCDALGAAPRSTLYTATCSTWRYWNCECSMSRSANLI